MNTKVRVATIGDEPEIIRLLHIMHGEGGLQSLDIGAAREMFDRAFSKSGGIIGVIGDSSCIEAMIFLLITRSWYTRENHLEEIFNFVSPDYRQSNHAKTLINFAKECAVQIGLPLIIGVMTNKRMVAKVQLYRGQLGAPAGAFFVYNSKWDKVVEPTSSDFWKAIETTTERRRRERRERSALKQG